MDKGLQRTITQFKTINGLDYYNRQFFKSRVYYLKIILVDDENIDLTFHKNWHISKCGFLVKPFLSYCIKVINNKTDTTIKNTTGFNIK